MVLEASGIDFGLILEGLERLEGGFGEGLGRILACFGLFWLVLASSGFFWLLLSSSDMMV